MSQCHGCKTLKTICEDCGRTVCKIENASVRWISVKESLPPEYSRVLVYVPGKDYGTFGHGDYHVCPYIHKDCLQGATHWMPLPTAPEDPEERKKRFSGRIDRLVEEHKDTLKRLRDQ